MNTRSRFLPLLVVCGLGLRLFTTSASGALDEHVIFTGEMTREFRLEPGGRAEGRLSLHNPSATSTLRARVYQTDYTFNALGGASYAEPGSSPRSSARWIEIDDPEPELSPGETRSVVFKIVMPHDPSLRGTYWSMIMVEPISTAPLPPPGTVVIRSVMRYGIQVVLQTGGTLELKPEFTGQTVVRENGGCVLAFDLNNRGDSWLRPKVEVRLYDAKGQPVGVVGGRPARVYPGTSVRHSFPLGSLPVGKYVALLVLDNDDQLFGAEYRFEVGD